MTQLYLLAQEYRAGADKLADLELDDQTIADTLEGLGGELEAKATNVAMFARNLDATAAAIKLAEEDMRRRRQAIENRADSIRKYLLRCMQSAGVGKIECPHFRLTVRENPPSVEVFEPGLLDAEFMRVTPPPPPAPDKRAIAEAFKAGRDVQGARIINTQRLEIK